MNESLESTESFLRTRLSDCDESNKNLADQLAHSRLALKHAARRLVLEQISTVLIPEPHPGTDEVIAEQEAYWISCFSESAAAELKLLEPVEVASPTAQDA